MDVDGTTLLGGELAKRASEVNQALHSDPLRLVQAQTNFEENQHNGNAKINIFSAYGLLPEGEWIVCASSEASCEMGMSESTGIADKAEAFTQMLAKSSQQLAGMDGDTGQKVEPTDTTNVPEALVTTLINLENLDHSDMQCMYLGSMNWHVGNPNGLGSQTDGSSCKVDVLTGQVDVLRGWTETLSMSDSSEMASISHEDDLGSYLGTGGAKHSAEVTEGFGSYMDPLSARTGILSMGMDMNMTVNEAETISMRPVELKLPKLPTRGKSSHADEMDRSRNHPSMSSTCMDAYTIRNKTETTENKVEIISMRLKEPKPPDPLTMGANACANKPNSCGNPAHMLTGHRETPGVEMV